jgi:hypothetical protein
MKNNSNLRIVVNSKNIVIGTAIFSTEKLVKTKSDDGGVRRVWYKIVYIYCLVQKIYIRFFH